MVNKLVSRAEFARRAGVSGAAVTKACSSVLKETLTGKRIDMTHPSAVKYLKEKALGQTPPAATGLDPLYEPAVKFCQESGFYSIAKLQKQFRIGFSRAKIIIGVMTANDLINKKPYPVVTKKTVKKPHVRGTAAAKETKKQHSPSQEEIIEIPSDIQMFADMTLRELIEKFGTDCRFVDWLSATQKIEAINEKRLKNAATEGELVSRNLVRVGIIEPIDACHIKLLTDGAKTIARRATAMHSAERSLKDIEKFVKDQLTSFIRPVKAKVARALNNA